MQGTDAKMSRDRVANQTALLAGESRSADFNLCPSLRVDRRRRWRRLCGRGFRGSRRTRGRIRGRDRGGCRGSRLRLWRVQLPIDCAVDSIQQGPEPRNPDELDSPVDDDGGSVLQLPFGQQRDGLVGGRDLHRHVGAGLPQLVGDCGRPRIVPLYGPEEEYLDRHACRAEAEGQP